MMQHTFKAGDVVSYSPPERWCREGTAIAVQLSGSLGPVVLLDTFWRGGGVDQHRLTPDEIATATLVFNIADYDELDCYAYSSETQWDKFAPADRELITSQHGLQKRWFIRKGASEDWGTQIDNARQKVAKREAELASAQRELQWARDDLDQIIAKSAQVAS